MHTYDIQVFRIQLKLDVLIYMAHNGQSPTYISDTLTPVSRGPARGRLRSRGGAAVLKVVVQIFLQNHGYTFHPEDLEKGQGDSR